MARKHSHVTSASGTELLAGWSLPSDDDDAAGLMRGGANGDHSAGGAGHGRPPKSPQSPYPRSNGLGSNSKLTKPMSSSHPFLPMSPVAQRNNSGDMNGIAALDSPTRGGPLMTTFPAWMDPRSCCLCRTVPVARGNSSTDLNNHGKCYLGDDTVCGRLMPLPDGSYAHVNCLRWSSEVNEMSGKLHDFEKAKNRSKMVTCSLCNGKGATIGCMLKSCKRSFHLKCALAASCCLMEARPTTDPADSPHAIYTMMACPEHLNRIDRTKMTRQWTPEDPIRSLTTAESCNALCPLDYSFNAESPVVDLPSVQLSELLSQGHKADRAVRCGSLTVHSIGTPRIYPEPEMANAGFHSATHIFPYRYRSSRIFWSMRHPWKRTLYIFEICTETDIEGFQDSMLLENLVLPEAQMHSINGSGSASNGHASSSASAFDADPLLPSSSDHMSETKEKGIIGGSSGEVPSVPVPSPIFRIIALDLFLNVDEDGDNNGGDAPSLPPQPMLTRSIDLAFSTIKNIAVTLQAADVAKRGYRWTPRASAQSSLLTFGRSAAQFFGLGLPVVKQAIEMIPDSHAAMIAAPPAPQYRPSFRLARQVGVVRFIFSSSIAFSFLLSILSPDFHYSFYNYYLLLMFLLLLFLTVTYCDLLPFLTVTYYCTRN